MVDLPPPIWAMSTNILGFFLTVPLTDRRKIIEGRISDRLTLTQIHKHRTLYSRIVHTKTTYNIIESFFRNKVDDAKKIQAVQFLVDGGSNYHFEKAIVEMKWIKETDFEGSELLYNSTSDSKKKVSETVKIIMAIHKIR